MVKTLKQVKEVKTKAEIAKQLKQEKANRKEAEERKKAWAHIALPAAQLISDLATKGDLTPVNLDEKLLNPTLDWLENLEAKKHGTMRRAVVETKSDSGDDDDSEVGSDRSSASLIMEQNKFAAEKLDDDDDTHDGLDEFRGIAEVKEKRVTIKPKITTMKRNKSDFFSTAGKEKAHHFRASVSSDRKIKPPHSSISRSSSVTKIPKGPDHFRSVASASIAITGDAHSSLTGSGTDDEPWNDDELVDHDAKDGRPVRPVYELVELDIQPDEAIRDLEELLDELQMEARITERYKYRLINKFSLFLQALITFQERELEMIESSTTKWKILDVLTEFVKNEIEEANKVVIAEEKQEKEEMDQGLILDLSSKTEGRRNMEEGEEMDKMAQDSHGLSIEEMPAPVIRETLLHQKNRLEIQEDMRRIQILEAKQLEFEKTLLTLHYSRMIKPTDLHKEMKEGRRAVNDLENELSQIQQEMSQLQTDIAVEEKAIQDEEKSVEKIELEALTKQNEVQQNSNKPVHLSKEADREAHKLELLEDQISQVNTKFLDDFEEMRILQNKIDKLMSELNALIKDESNMHRKRKNSLHETENLLSQMESLVSREQSLLERAANMTEKLAHTTKQKRKLQEELHQLSNEANKSHREGQKLERTIRMSTDAYLNSKLAYDKMKAAYDATKPKNEENSWEKLSRMFLKEIRNLKNALHKKLGDASHKSNVVEKLQKELNESYENQISAGKKLQELIRLAVKRRHERDEKSEQCIQLERQITKLLEEKKTQDIKLEDLIRAEMDYKGLVRQTTDNCHKAKLAKAAMISDLVSARETLTDANDKQNSLDKEIEQTGADIKAKEQQLGEIYYVTLNAYLTRDSERNAALRNMDKLRRHRIERNELLIATKTQRREMARQKLEVISIRQEYEKHRSEICNKAQSVRERNQEISVVTEKMTLYNDVLLRGSAAVTVREMEKSKLSALYEEIRKHLFIVKINQPDEKSIIQKIEYLRDEFGKRSTERRALEGRLDNDDSPALVREIRFDLMEKIENYEALRKRLDRAESELASRDALGLERSLMDKQLDDNIAQFIQHAKYLKSTYAGDVKVLVNLRKSLATISRRIDGMICEAALAIGQSDTAEKEFFKLKAIVDKSEERFNQRLPPSEDLEKEWKRLKWREEMMRRSQLPKGNYRTKTKRLTGSQIIMERMRPKPKGQLSPCYLGPDLNILPDKTKCVKVYKQGAPKKVKHSTGIGQCFAANCGR